MDNVDSIREELALLRNKVNDMIKYQNEEIKNITDEINRISSKIDGDNFNKNCGRVGVTLEKNDATLHTRRENEKTENFGGYYGHTKPNNPYGNNGYSGYNNYNRNNVNTHTEYGWNNPYNQTKQRNFEENVNKFTSIISEVNFGRYILGILASLLVLVSIGVFAKTFWEYIPYIVKWGSILTFGSAMHIVGSIMTKRNKGFNGFWVSIASCGSGVTFISLICGHMLWDLYGLLITALGLILWFIATLYTSNEIKSLVFYIVSHIGAVISLSIALYNFSEIEFTTLTDHLLLVVMMVIWIAVSRVIKSSIKGSKVVQYLFTYSCMILSVIALAEMGLADGSDSVYIANILMLCISLGISILSLIDARKLKTDYAIINRIILFIANISGVLAMNAAISKIELSNDNMIYYMMLMVLIIIAVVEYIYKAYDLVVDTTLIKAVAIAEISSYFLSGHLVGLFAAAISSMGLAYTHKNKYYEFKITSAIYTLIALCYIPGHLIYIDTIAGNIDIVAQFMLALIIPAIEYVNATRNKGGLTKTRQLISLGFAIIFSVLILGKTDLNIIYPMFILSMIYLAHRLFSERKLDLESSDDILSVITRAIISTPMHGYIYFKIWECETPDMLLSTFMLLAFAFCSVILSIRKRYTVATLFTVMMFNINMIILACAWNDDNLMLSISLIGLLTSAMFIAFGFIFRNKSMRVAGLVTTVIYVLKMVIIDVMVLGDSGLNPLFIGLGGIICFILSFAYNKLDKKFG